MRNLFTAFLTATISLTAAIGAQAANRPNFVFILGEAQGWSSMSFKMNPDNPRSKSDFYYTPNLARIAEGGMRFSRFYAPSPRCTPSRAAYFTGKSPAQLHMTFINTGAGGRVIMRNSSTELPLSEVTIAEHLKSVGYTSAHFGKWHVGRTHPSRHGFDKSDGATSNRGPENVQNPNPKQFYATAASGIEFMSAQVKAGKPFYLQVSHYGGRSALDCKPETLEIMRKRVGRRDLPNLTGAAVALDADLATGLILDALDSLGIADNTYIFYTADHGSQGRNGPLSNGKGSVKEGGIRVPLLFRGPGIKPGTFARMVTSGVDLFPTISQLAGITAPSPPGVEGGSLADILKNEGQGTAHRPREEFVVHFPHYDKDPLGPASSILLDEFKLIRYFETGDRQLFNLRTDLGERNNLASEMPEKAEALDKRLSAYLKEVNADLPEIDRSRPANTGAAPRRGRGGNRPSAILQALDVNQDGIVSPEEMANAAAVLMKFDRDGDGKVSADEIRRATRGGQGGNRERRPR